VTARPTIAGSALKRRFHRPSLKTITAAGVPNTSSSAENVRPRTGLTPSSEK
jgi:hypothetical protein